MGSELLQQRHEAHQLLDELPEEKLQIVRGLLDRLVQPLSVALAAAPFEDEELTPETIAAIEQGERDYAEGRIVTHEEMLREFGG